MAQYIPNTQARDLARRVREFDREIEAEELRLQGVTPCRRGHYAKRHPSNGACVECARLASKRYTETNAETEKARKRQAWRRTRIDAKSYEK